MNLTILILNLDLWMQIYIKIPIYKPVEIKKSLFFRGKVEKIEQTTNFGQKMFLYVSHKFA